MFVKCGLFLGLSVIVTFSGTLAHAGSQADYLTIGSVETHEVVSSDASGAKVASSMMQAKDILQPSPYTNLGGNLSVADQQCVVAESKGGSLNAQSLSLADLGEIVKVGKEVWTMIENNKPVVNVKVDTVTVMPLKAECWRWLTGWQDPVAKSYTTTFKNLYGMKVVDFTYKLIYLYGGNFEGKGKYLARVALVPENLDVAWGYTFNATVSVPTVLNYGTVVDPVAAVEVQLDYSIDTVLKHHSSTANFLVKGNGEGLAL